MEQLNSLKRTNLFQARASKRDILIFKKKHICRQKKHTQLTNLIFLIIIFALLPMVSAQAKSKDKDWKELLIEKTVKSEDEKSSKQDEMKINQLNKLIEQDIKKEIRGKVPRAISDIKEIEKEVEFASRITGVRKEFLMGMLVVESDLGRNTGKCTYQEVREGAEDSHSKGRLSKQAWETFQERKKIIQDIADSLGYDADKLGVSCNPPYSGTGGAMGIPQFMPDTWMEYKDEIASIVGNKNPDPWSARDGVLAMALKVADVPGVVEHNVWAERNASKMYLSGTTSSLYEWYASQIQYWARNYEELIG